MTEPLPPAVEASLPGHVTVAAAFVDNEAYDDARPDDVVVFVDTEGGWPKGRLLRIRVNDAVVYEGNPERDNLPDVVDHVFTTYYGSNGRDLIL